MSYISIHFQSNSQLSFLRDLKVLGPAFGRLLLCVTAALATFMRGGKFSP